MPLITASTPYKPPLWLRNGHINTFYPYFFRKRIRHNYTRVRYETPDDDFYDVDWLLTKDSKKLVILLHGLEGSSDSQYIMGTTHALSQNGYNIAAFNFRSCSGEMNQQPALYHSGWTRDLHQLITHAANEFDEIFICGFSLGGNVTMKYLGDGVYPLSHKIKASAGISVPCDLRAGSIKIMHLKNHFYENKFLETLLAKMKIKQQQFPEVADFSKISKVKTLWDFDEYFTAPIHGFRDAEDYYACCNSLRFLENIKLPSLIINALDDSFLPASSYPYSQAESNENLFLMTPKHGGHVGFTTFGTSHYWVENEILRFFERYSAIPAGNKK
jgi:predicted alpha/beta-fold hydrolase